MRSRASLSASSASPWQAFSAASISAAVTRKPILARSIRSNLAVNSKRALVATRRNVGDDAAHGLLDVLRRLALDREKAAKTLGKSAL